MTMPGIHELAKPIGPVCDIKCDYCFYLEKRVLFGKTEHYRMPDDVLGDDVAQYVEAQPTPVIEAIGAEAKSRFTWHIPSVTVEVR